MSESLLKKEFKERDFQRVRNLITKKFGNKTGTQIGYTRTIEDHKEGDVWVENNKTWTIKNGIKQTMTKLDIVKQTMMMPLLCPSCHKPMKTRYDKKMYHIHKICFECTIQMESELKRTGKYQEYMENMITNNMLDYVKDAKKFVQEYIDGKEEDFYTEHGDKEEFVGGGESRRKIAEEWLKELEEIENQIKK